MSESSEISESNISYNAFWDALLTDGMIKICSEPEIKDRGGDLSKEWFVQYYYRKPDGNSFKLFRITTGINIHKTLEKRRAQCEKVCAEQRAKLLAGYNPFSEAKILIRDHLKTEAQRKKEENTFGINFYMNLFLEAKKKGDRRDTTIKTYTTKLRAFEAWYIKNIITGTITDFTKAEAIKFSDDLIAGKVTDGPIENKTINSYISTLEITWNWLENYDEKLITKNPWEKIENLSVHSKPKKIFSTEQREKVFNYLAARGEWPLWIICHLIYKSFIRPGREMHGLQVEDFRFNENRLCIEGDISKNRETEYVPIPLEVILKLKELGIENAPEKFYVFGKGGISQIPFSRDYWSKRFTQFRKQLQLPSGLTIYCLKHTGNQKAHKKGMPLEVQRKLNRHKSIETTKVYLEGMKIEDSEELEIYFKD